MTIAMPPGSSRPDAASIACDSCVLGRRAFLREAGALAAGALVALGATPRLAAASTELIDATSVSRELKRYPLPAKDGAQIDKDNELILARFEGKVYVFSLACPHQNTAIHWYEKEHQFECPKHHSKYRPDGAFIEGRATRSLDRFSVRRDGDSIVADIDKLFEEDHDAEWKTAFVAV